jgi:hypothetical protein
VEASSSSRTLGSSSRKEPIIERQVLAPRPAHGHVKLSFDEDTSNWVIVNHGAFKSEECECAVWVCV